MKIPFLPFLGLMLMGACAQPPASGAGAAPSLPATIAPDPARATWRVTDITVVVPSGLSVSRNPGDRFPDTDIVWWGDPEGDGDAARRAQVAAIVAQAASTAAPALSGWREVSLQVEVLRFHSLTPSSREFGAWGFHDLDFALSVSDAETGAELSRSDQVEADFDAYQRGDAVAADARGETQKVRVTQKLATRFRAWLLSGR